MAQQVSGAAIVAFEDSRLGSAAEELDGLGDREFLNSLKYLDKIVSGDLDYRGLKEFDNFGGVPLIKAEFHEVIVIFAVQEDEVADRKVTVMFAGRRGVSFAAGGLQWDGDNDEALRCDVVHARAVAWFS